MAETPLPIPELLSSTGNAPGIPQSLGTQPSYIQGASASSNLPQSRVNASQGAITRANQPKGSKLPTMIAIAAAANGNFGPLSQLLEQKRKTQLFQTLQQPLKDRSAALQEGDTKLASEIEAKIIGSIGGRSPEMLNMMSQLQAQTTGIQRDAVYAKNWVKFLDPAMKAAGPSMPQTTKDMYGVLKGAIGGSQHVSREFLQDFMNRNAQHLQNITGAYRSMSPLTGQATTTPNVELVQASQLNDSVVLGALGDAGITPNQAMNVANNPRDPKSQQVQSLIAQANSTRRNFELAKVNVPEGFLREELLRMGKTQEQVGFGDYDRNDIATAMQGVIDRNAQQVAANVGASLPETQQLLAINKATGQRVPGMTINQAIQSDQATLLNKDQVAEATLLYKARDQFRLLLPIITASPDVDNVGDRVGNYFTALANRFTFISPEMTERKIAQVVIADTIEQYTNATRESGVRFKEVREAVESPKATKQSIIESMRVMSGMLQADLNRIMLLGDASARGFLPGLPTGGLSPVPSNPGSVDVPAAPVVPGLVPGGGR